MKQTYQVCMLLVKWLAGSWTIDCEVPECVVFGQIAGKEASF
jgi:hypothetical protein